MTKKILMIFILFVFMGILLAFPGLCIYAALEGLLLWFNKVLPSLLPFMILINMLMQLDSIKIIGQHVTSITYKLWHLPGSVLFAFMMGLLAGYPMGARVIKELVNAKELTPEQGEHALCFCNNCGPLFIVGTVGTVLLDNTKLGYFLLLIHILSALITSLLLRSFFSFSLARSLPHPKVIPSTKTLPTLFNEAVAQSMDTMTCIGGYIIFFSVLAHLLTDTKLLQWLLHLPLLGQASPELSQATLTSFLELSNGVNALSHTSSLYTLPLFAAALGFGGLCVFFQTLYILGDISFSTKPYFLSKCLQGIISFLLTCNLYPFFSVYTQGTKVAFNPIWYLISLLFIITLFIFSYFTKSTHRQSITLKRNKEF